MTMYYAIRHKPTGHFLPRYPGQKGGTWVEPTDKEPPRLFKTGRHAAVALGHWLQGQKTVTYTRRHSMWGDEDWPEEVVKPVESRIATDMEIVRIRLEVDHD